MLVGSRIASSNASRLEEGEDLYYLLGLSFNVPFDVGLSRLSSLDRGPNNNTSTVTTKVRNFSTGLLSISGPVVREAYV